MNHETEEFQEKAYINRMALIGHTVIVAVLFLAYTLELIKGSRTVPYYLIFILLASLPVLAEHILYRREPESKYIQYIMGIGYGILYFFAIFTTNSVTPFVYAFPMYMVVILYMDVIFGALIGAAVLVGNIVYIAYYAFTVGYGASEVPDLEIRIASVLLTGGFMVISTSAVKRVNAEKLKIMERQTQENNAMLNRILEVSGSMISGIADAADKMEKVGESVSHMQVSMSQLSEGSTETAESVQIQSQRTEQIQQHIVNVKDTTDEIEHNMVGTVQKVEEGREQMDALAEQVEKSIAANREMLAKMNALQEYANQMNTIIETITSIAGSTGMLALNASIEAARAGEAGKGFAVVADEISQLASETKTATVDITKLIDHINIELQSVADAVDVVTDSNHANAGSAQAAKDNFDSIADSTEVIRNQTGRLQDIVSQLETANADIVENIRTISSAVQEFSACADETYDACENNSHLIGSVTEIVHNLNEDARKLQAGS